ncbi:hypothetical protein AB0L75_33035 [Streptomyces sp. NPDC052101]|uniref:hypothetical protein n=1 Tax=Streptomyces sp. NPDC052101 TaxID=3155763 RepID=UPI003425AE44
MRNQRALAAACAAVAALGLAAPVAVADGMDNGGGPSNNNAGFGNGGGPSDNNAGFGNGGGPSDNNAGFGNGGGPSNNNGGQDSGSGISGNFNIRGHFNDNGGRGDGGREQGRGDDFGGRGDDFGGRGDDSGGRGDGGPRNIFATPGVIASGARLTVTVTGCRGGTMSSRAFPTTQLNPFHDDTARGSARIDRDARPGRYDITVHCEGRSLTRPGTFTVLGGVQGGVGGSISSGATSADMAIGAGLVASAVVGGGVFWLRRRNEKRI